MEGLRLLLSQVNNESILKSCLNSTTTKDDKCAYHSTFQKSWDMITDSERDDAWNK